MIRVSFFNGTWKDIEEPTELHRDGEFLSFQKADHTILAVNVANVIAIEPLPNRQRASDLASFI